MLVGLLALAALPSFAGIRLGEWEVNSLQIDGVSHGGRWYVTPQRLLSQLAYRRHVHVLRNTASFAATTRATFQVAQAGLPSTFSPSSVPPRTTLSARYWRQRK